MRTVSKLEDQARRGAEQVESLKNSLLEETNVSAKQRIELERLKVELEKAKDLIEKLKSAENEKYFADAKFDLLSERDEGMVNFCLDLVDLHFIRIKTCLISSDLILEIFDHSSIKLILSKLRLNSVLPIFEKFERIEIFSRIE